MDISKNKSVKIGDEIPSLIRKADVGEREKRYPDGVVHNEKYAKSVGLRGALVPGQFVLGNVIDMLVRYFGKWWHTAGEIDIKFLRGGVIHGETITARGVIVEKASVASGMRLSLDIWVDREDGSKAAVGTASCFVPLETEESSCEIKQPQETC